MITKHTAELAYLFQTRQLSPNQVIVVNEVAYWYDKKEVDDAIEHAKKRLVERDDSTPEAFNHFVRWLRSVYSRG
jgi:uncharacterized FlgJ-related protein